ncbi:MAG: hypothetical protein AAFX78_03770 [Cyanobacteria bacterium J06638_20]
MTLALSTQGRLTLQNFLESKRPTYQLEQLRSVLINIVGIFQMNQNRLYKSKQLSGVSDNKLQSILKDYSQKFRIIWPIAIVGGLTTISFFLIIAFYSMQGVSPDVLTRDPVAIARLPAYSGMFSQIGLLLWATSVAICLFSSKLLANRISFSKVRRFLFISGILTLMVELDDVFLLHEDVFPSMGIPEKLVLGVYGISMLLYLLKFFPILLKTEYAFFLMALVGFGSSIFLDVILPPGLHYIALEDGAKLVGIVFWTIYFYRTAVSFLSAASKTDSIRD